jgi:hypothetical protein
MISESPVNFLLRISEWFQSPTGIFRKTAWLLLCLSVGCMFLSLFVPWLAFATLPALLLSLLMAFVASVVRLFSR